MKLSNLLWALPLLSLLAMPATADRYYDDDFGDYYANNKFERRLDRQHRRIKQGVRSGELTRKEAKRLRKQHRHIARLERKFGRDGHLNRYERRKLRRKLNAASDRIYRLKHNDRYRDRDYHRHHKRDRHYTGDRHHKRNRRHDHDYYDAGGWGIVFSLWDEL